MSSTGGYKYMEDIYGILSQIFSHYNNCYIFDYTDMSSMDVSDYDFVDGFHGSELIYDYILQDICNPNNDVQKFLLTLRLWTVYIKNISANK